MVYYPHVPPLASPFSCGGVNPPRHFSTLLSLIPSGLVALQTVRGTTILAPAISTVVVNSGHVVGALQLAGGLNQLAMYAREDHHIMTNKNRISKAAGGPYTPKFEELAARRGIDLENLINHLSLENHIGPHPAYNAEVYRLLMNATKNLTGNQFNEAFDLAMEEIRQLTATPGTLLNRLATGG